MNDKQRVLNAIIKIFKNKDFVLDVMEVVNSESLCMDEIRFSETMYELQKEGLISGVIFENGNPKRISLWDDIRVNTAKFKAH